MSSSRHEAHGESPSPFESSRPVIVCGVDQSEHCRRALRVGAELAERLDSQLVLVNVRPSPADLPPGMAAEIGIARERAVEGGRRLFAELGDELVSEPSSRPLLKCVRARVEFGEPAAALNAVADELRASMIVVGARGRGAAGAALLGSVSQNLAAERSRPLLVVPPEADVAGSGVGEARSASIVCGVDGSPSATEAVRVAGWLAAALGLRLVLVHVEQEGDEVSTGTMDFDILLGSDTRPRLRLLHRAVEAAGRAEVEVRLASGSAATALEDVAARESAELIAVGTRGHGAVKALVLGSVSRALAASGSRPVLIVNERLSRDCDGVHHPAAPDPGMGAGAPERTAERPCRGRPR